MRSKYKLLKKLNFIFCFQVHSHFVDITEKNQNMPGTSLQSLLKLLYMLSFLSLAIHHLKCFNALIQRAF